MNTKIETVGTALVWTITRAQLRHVPGRHADPIYIGKQPGRFGKYLVALGTKELIHKAALSYGDAVYHAQEYIKRANMQGRYNDDFDILGEQAQSGQRMYVITQGTYHKLAWCFTPEFAGPILLDQEIVVPGKDPIHPKTLAELHCRQPIEAKPWDVNLDSVWHQMVHAIQEA